MSSTIHLAFRYSEKDYVRALRAHYAARLRLPWDIAAIIGAAVLGVWLWYSSLRWLGMILLAISAVFALMLIAAFFVIPPIVFRREPKFRDEYSLTFSPEGIHFRTAQIDSHLQWSMYSQALIGPHSFVLYYGNRSFTVIPRRVFENKDQENAFEQLLVEKNVLKLERHV